MGLDQTFPNHKIATLLYSPQFMKNNPGAAKRFMVAYVEGMRDYNDAFVKNKNKADIVAILPKRTTVKDVSLYDKMTMAGLNPDGYANPDSIAVDLDWFVANG